MIKCPTCGTENLEGSQFCDECGATLGGGRQPGDVDSFAPAYAPPNFQSANVTSVGIPIVEELKLEETAEASEPTEENAPAKGVHATLSSSAARRSEPNST